MQLFQKEKKLVSLEKYCRKKHQTHPSHEAVWIADDGLQCHDQPIRGLRTVVRPSLECTHEHAFTSLARLGDVHFLFLKKKDVQWTIRNRTPNNWANTLALVDVGELYVWVQSQRTSCCSPRSAR
jgi:hypothetical protein